MDQRAIRQVDYSIIICTYNPDERILKRCLQAVCGLDAGNISTEVILVDNNSEIPVKDLPCVKDCRRNLPSMHTIEVHEQGVVFARIAAIREARGIYIVYFDYDNEPQRDYLQALKKLHAQYPRVAAWGPGHVRVDLIDGIDKRIERYARIAFQERQEEEIRFATVPEWQPCYPFGTGLCTYAFLLKEYISRAEQGQFTLTGRKGARLDSGEDTQMVMLCIRMGYAAGVAPSLKMTHIIPGTKANYPYLRRLAYGTAICYETCLLQVFPERRALLEDKIPGAPKFFRQVLKKLIRSGWTADPERTFELVSFIGLNAGIYTALNKQIPGPVKRIIKYLEIESNNGEIT